jgi:hypothetical protein
MFSLGRRCAPRYCHPLPRGYRSSAPRHNEQPPPGADDLHAAGPYKKWLEEVAQRFKIAKPRQWLKPDTVRVSLYAAHLLINAFLTAFSYEPFI